MPSIVQPVISPPIFSLVISLISLSEDHGIWDPQMFVSRVSLVDFRNSAVSCFSFA